MILVKLISVESGQDLGTFGLSRVPIVGERVAIAELREVVAVQHEAFRASLPEEHQIAATLLVRMLTGGRL